MSQLKTTTDLLVETTNQYVNSLLLKSPSSQHLTDYEAHPSLNIYSHLLRETLWTRNKEVTSPIPNMCWFLSGTRGATTINNGKFAVCTASNSGTHLTGTWVRPDTETEIDTLATPDFQDTERNMNFRNVPRLLTPSIPRTLINNDGGSGLAYTKVTGDQTIDINYAVPFKASKVFVNIPEGDPTKYLWTSLNLQGWSGSGWEDITDTNIDLTTPAASGTTPPEAIIGSAAANWLTYTVTPSDGTKAYYKYRFNFSGSPSAFVQYALGELMAVGYLQDIQTLPSSSDWVYSDSITGVSDGVVCHIPFNHACTDVAKKTTQDIVTMTKLKASDCSFVSGLHSTRVKMVQGYIPNISNFLWPTDEYSYFVKGGFPDTATLTRKNSLTGSSVSNIVQLSTAGDDSLELILTLGEESLNTGALASLDNVDHTYGVHVVGDKVYLSVDAEVVYEGVFVATHSVETPYNQVTLGAANASGDNMWMGFISDFTMFRRSFV